MKELTLSTLIAVFEEMFGRGLFWALVAAALAITALYVFVLIRDRSLSMRKFLWAQLSMPIGAIAAVLFVQGITSSGFKDIGCAGCRRFGHSGLYRPIAEPPEGRIGFWACEERAGAFPGPFHLASTTSALASSV